MLLRPKQINKKMQRTLSAARQTLSVVRRRAVVPVRGMAGGKIQYLNIIR